ncbi:MAG: PilZ domain-containing protein [bacterium]|nr:PilZ domain-containing protein [bacterium]
MSNAQIQVKLGRCETQGGTSSELSIDERTRYKVDNVEGRLGTFDTANVVNISLGGLAIETHKYLQVGKSYPMRFKRPTGLLRLSATVVWSRLIRTVPIENKEFRPIYMAGFRFSSLTAKQRAELEAFIVDEVDRTAAGRAEPRLDASA